MRTIYLEKEIPRIALTLALKKVWSGVVYSKVAPVYYADIQNPELPGARWVRLQNLMCGICATDLMLFNLDLDIRVGAAALPGIQRVFLGHEVVSRVVEVGPDVTSLKVGDRVVMKILRLDGPTCFSLEIDPLCQSCAAGNYAVCENTSIGKGPLGIGGGWGDGYIAHESEVFKVPDQLTDEQAVMIEPLAVAVRTVLRRLPAAGEHVLVVGSGTVGLNVIQVLRALSPACHISVMARYPHQKQLARRFGADEIIGDEDGYEATVRLTCAKLYEGMLGARMVLGGFDVIYDCIGSAQTIQDSLRWTRAGGTVVMAGSKAKLFKLDLLPVWYQEVDLIGLSTHGAEHWNGVRISTYDLTLDLVLEGKLEVDGMITHRFPLDKWREAISTAQDKRTGAVKVVFDYR